MALDRILRAGAVVVMLLSMVACSAQPSAPESKAKKPDEPQGMPAVATTASLQPVESAASNGTFVVEVATGKLFSVIPGGGSWMPGGSSLSLGTCCGEESGLYVVEPGGTASRILNGDIANHFWAPDGKSFAVVRSTPMGSEQDGLYLVSRDGTSERLLARERAIQVVWSRDSSRLAYLKETGELVIVAAATGESLGSVKDVRVVSMGLSPDGQLLAIGTSDGVQLYDVAKGSSAKLVPGKPVIELRWAPDGSRFVAVQLDTKGGQTGLEEGFSMAVVDPKNPSAAQLVTDIQSPNWSFDGKEITYLTNGCATNTWDLVAVDAADTTKSRPLSASSTAFKAGPALSGDGRLLAYGEGSKLMLLDTATASAKVLVDSGKPGILLWPAESPWSSDGRFLLFYGGGGRGLCGN